MSELPAARGGKGGPPMTSIATGSRGLADGLARRDVAHRLLAARRDVFVRRGRRALLRAMLAGNGVATADDVRAAVPLPPGVNPKLFGPVPTELVAAGVIAADGYAKSNRPEAHARPVQVWRLVDRAAAERWLRENPDLPDPAQECPTAPGDGAVTQVELF